MDATLIDVQKIEAEWLTNQQISLDVLRLDKIDPIVSGNKWFKLKYYFEEAKSLEKTTVATFGGAWSNHIVAVAFAAREAGFKSIGVIRGEKPTQLSTTLEMAVQYGMNLHFVTRDQYRRKAEVIENFSQPAWYWINEGGFGAPGAKGASEILKILDTLSYSHIIAAVGTGTMLAGLVLGSAPYQNILGISSMKGNFSLMQQIEELTERKPQHVSFDINHDYHFGGYGKHPHQLITFMNDVYTAHQLPLDIVYTGKTFYAIKDMTEKMVFNRGSKLLMVHSGGLQGNKSLPEKLLAF